MENNEVPSSDPVVNFKYSDGTSLSTPIDWKECSDQELLHFWEIAHSDGARLEYRERTGQDLKITLFSSTEEQKQYHDWFSNWAKLNPEKFKEFYLENN
jgi:hypothetical protein